MLPKNHVRRTGSGNVFAALVTQREKVDPGEQMFA
jgi:hypothetical protein